MKKKLKIVKNNKKTSLKSSKEPQTMDELLSQTNYKLQTRKVGDVVEAVVTEKTGKAIYLNIGGKTEGMVIDREMKAAKDFIKDLKIGDKVLAVITQPENDKGQTLLSFKKAAFQKTWDDFEEKLKTGEPLKVRGIQVNKGGLIVEAKGEVQGFIPASQFSSTLSGDVQQFVGKELEVKVIEVDRAKNRLVFSEKAVSEAGLLKKQQKALERIKVGDILEGEVSGVMPFGLFVRIKQKTSQKTPITIEGLVHISEISWEKVNNPSKFYKQGDKVKVKVLAIDKKTGKLNLSIKQLLPDPWENIEEKYPSEAKVRGEVKEVVPFGVFVILEPGIEGLIHISKIPAEKTFKSGEKVDCFVEFLDKENRRLSLGLVLKEKPVGYK